MIFHLVCWNTGTHQFCGSAAPAQLLMGRSLRSILSKVNIPFKKKQAYLIHSVTRQKSRRDCSSWNKKSQVDHFKHICLITNSNFSDGIETVSVSNLALPAETVIYHINSIFFMVRRHIKIIYMIPDFIAILGQKKRTESDIH